jgi:hypothetical protein
MDINEYVLEGLVRDKLQDARATTARRARLVSARPPRPALRSRLGLLLIAMGQRLAGAPAPGLAGRPVRLRPGVTVGAVDG